MKKVYASIDGKLVLQFFIDPSAIKSNNIVARMNSILGSYNPCLSEEEGGADGNTAHLAEYYRRYFSWPVAITDDPEFGFGIICQSYPKRFLYPENAFVHPAISKKYAGEPRDCSWYITQKTKMCLKETEQGDFRKILSICLCLARMTDRLHRAGLAHSDLSCKNILIDLKHGDCLITDVDGLVVPGLYMPEVNGTKGYIAPEVLETSTLPFDKRKLPCVETDRHAMAVLFYELIFLRHPLLSGKKVLDFDDADNDDFLKLGKEALFIENPSDTSNRPDKTPEISIKALGPDIEQLFLRVFVNGLHTPAARPTAGAWALSLSRAMDLLYPCPNVNCSAGWFVLHDMSNPVCPFCKTKLSTQKILRMRIKRPTHNKLGYWQDKNDVIILYAGAELLRKHFSQSISYTDSSGEDVCAEIKEDGGNLTLVNRRLSDLSLIDGSFIPEGKSIVLKPNMWFYSRSGDEGLLIEIEGRA